MLDAVEIVGQQAIAGFARGDFGEALAVGAVGVDGVIGEPFGDDIEIAGVVALELGRFERAAEVELAGVALGDTDADARLVDIDNRAKAEPSGTR